MNKQQLASKIWESANKMRSKIEANEYKDFILGFIFYKFLSEREEQFLLSEGMTAADMEAVSEEDEETLVFVKNNLGYFIGYDNLFSSWIEKGQDFEISNVRDALSAFNRHINPLHKKVFDGVFDTLETGLSKLGESAAAQTKAARDLIHLIRDIPMDTKQDYDVLGFIYEYLISNFAANAGKKAGEFYTPHEVSILMSEIVADHLHDRKEIIIYDPTSGSGSLLINIGSAISRRLGNDDGIKYYAQELKQNTFNLTRMNLVMRGIKPANIVVRNGDTLEDDWPWFDEADPAGTYDPLFVDAVVSNPPYSQQWDPEGKDTDPRFANFGIAPKSKADYAFLLHDLYHLRPHGIMTIVLPHGVLFRGGEEGTIRRNLIENDHIAAIIGLPANIFYGTGIPTIIMVLRKNRPESDVLIVDASKGFVKEGKNNKLRASDIKRIVDVVNARETVEGFSCLVAKEEIQANDYNLNIPRYVDSSEPAETWDLYSSMFGGIPVEEIAELDNYWKAFPGLREQLFTRVNDHCFEIATENIKEAITANSSVREYLEHFSSAFAGFKKDAVAMLIGGWQNVNSRNAEDELTNDIFERIAAFPLLDRYEAFQALDDAWNSISADLEMMQTEGFDATKRVDPKMVVKKKSGKDVELQDGWIGHIMPFELVQSVYLADDLGTLADLEDEQSRIAGECDSITEQLPDTSEDAEDAEECELSDQEIEDLQKDLARLQKRQKALKKEIKTAQDSLQERTTHIIKDLTDEQVYELLEKKWVDSLMEALGEIPQAAIDDLIKHVEALASKYKETYSSISEEIRETEKELEEMLSQLVGSEYDMLGINEFRQLLCGE